jgi:hypothetical protein
VKRCWAGTGGLNTHSANQKAAICSGHLPKGTEWLTLWVLPAADRDADGRQLADELIEDVVRIDVRKVRPCRTVKVRPATGIVPLRAKRCSARPADRSVLVATGRACDMIQKSLLIAPTQPLVAVTSTAALRPLRRITSCRIDRVRALNERAACDPRGLLKRSRADCRLRRTAHGLLPGERRDRLSGSTEGKRIVRLVLKTFSRMSDG